MELRRGVSLGRSVGVDRSSLRRWAARRKAVELPQELARFFETEEGVAWLRRVVAAAVFCITVLSPSGIRLVVEFLELSGLSGVVGASYGTIQKLVVAMEEEVVRFGQEQTTTMVSSMPQKSITLCEDETFHPSICLVAIEPVSGFLVKEGYADNRSADTWNVEVRKAMEGWPVKVIQSTSDEARALLRHAKDLAAHHSPDLFHVQQELIKATSRPLLARIEGATTRLASATRALAEISENRERYLKTRHGPGRPPDFDGRIREAQTAEQTCHQALMQAQTDRNDARLAIQAISRVYHPFDLVSGEHRSPELVERELRCHIDTVDAVARRAGLDDKASKRIHKARRLIAPMAATIAFVHQEISVRMLVLDLTEAERRAFGTQLLPGLYLRRVAGRAGTADERRALQDCWRSQTSAGFLSARRRERSRYPPTGSGV